MPYKYVAVKAEKLMSYKGVNIYRTYEDDDVSAGIYNHRFVKNPYDGEFESFDIRDLLEWEELPDDIPVFPMEDFERARDKHMKKILRKSINSGTINNVQLGFEP